MSIVAFFWAYLFYVSSGRRTRLLLEQGTSIPKKSQSQNGFSYELGTTPRKHLTFVEDKQLAKTLARMLLTFNAGVVRHTPGISISAPRASRARRISSPRTRQSPILNMPRREPNDIATTPVQSASDMYGSSENSSEALDKALESLEDDIMSSSPSARDAYSSSSERKSQLLRDIEGLALEARGFVEGVRVQLDRLQENVGERVKLEAKVALEIGDFLLRRALLDTSRVLGAGGRVLLSLSGGTSDEQDGENSTAAVRDEAMPFASRLEKIETKNIERLTSSSDSNNGEVRQLLSARETKDEEKRMAGEQWAQQAAAQEEGVTEAVELIKETSQWAAALLVVAATAASEALSKSDENGEKKTPGEPADALASVRSKLPAELPSADTMGDRAQKVGTVLQDIVMNSLETTRTDYASYRQLRDRGQLLELSEELEMLGVPTLSSPKLLGALDAGSSPERQRERREFDSTMKQLQLAAALGERAAKDSGDSFVYGILPVVTAAGKVAGRRIAEVPAKLTGQSDAVDRAQLTTFASREGAIVGLARDFVSQLTEEYASAVQSGVQSGILPDMTETVRGQTRRMLQKTSNALESAVSNADVDKILAGTAGVAGIASEQPKTTRGWTRKKTPSLQKETIMEVVERNSLRDYDVGAIDDEVLIGTVKPMPNKNEMYMGEDEFMDEEGCDVIVDAECVSVEDIEEINFGDQVVAAIDLSALALEVASDTIGQSPAAQVVSDSLDSLKPSETQEWKTLRSFRLDLQADQRRAETARRNLLDALTNFVKRK